jgi:methyltransferase-like protein/2-polyprenyl-3-methyl-5-hydroxy-6-metoxy-1,4-benzoquinol methylase
VQATTGKKLSAALEVINQKISASYDETPYQSHPFSQTTPEHLFAIAHLFGIQATPVEHARILELGCASGGNLIPVAVRLPNAHLVGLDISTSQIAEGQATITRLGLNNISLQHADLSEVNKSLGQFDYIIAHGVYSWIPADVQAAMLRICKENLSPNGLAYISYNTYPGWKYREVIRDAMMFRGATRETPQERLSYARGMMDFLRDRTHSNSLSKENIVRALDSFKNQSDYYLIHEYLEECNFPCYFKDFIARANNNQMIYLAESQPSCMFVSHFPAETADLLLKECNGSQVVLEQHIDFLTDKTFRQTILIPEHRAAEIDYRLSHARLQSMHFSGIFTPVQSTTGQNDPANFTTYNNATINITHPLAIIAAEILSENYPSTLPVHAIALEMSKRSPSSDLTVCMTTVLDFVNSMVVRGTIRYRCSPVSVATEISEFPLQDRLACNTQSEQHFITNAWHENVYLNVVELSIWPLLDGSHDFAALGKHLKQEAASGQITFSQEGTPITDPAALDLAINDHLQTSLNSLKNKGLLSRQDAK